MKRASVSAAVCVCLLVAGLASVTAAQGTSQPSRPASLYTGDCHDQATPIGATAANDGEPSLRADPLDPNRLVASWTSNAWYAATAGGSPASNSPIGGSVTLAQRDASGQWTYEEVATGGRDFYYGDSWLDFSAQGTAYLSYIDSNLALHLRRVIPGQPAGPDLEPPFNWDHPAVAVDQLTSAVGDRLYLVGTNEDLDNSFTNFLATSMDGGKSWGSALPFPEPLPGYYPIAPVVASGRDRVLVSWAEYDETHALRGAIRAAAFDEKSQQFSSVRTLARTNYGPGGTSFGWQTIPSLAVARSGPVADTAYVTWAENTAFLSSPDIFLSTSRDGVHWSRPRKVNDDDPGPLATTIQAYPSVSARSDGGALVAWMDGRDDQSGDSLRMYVAPIDSRGNVGPNRRVTSCPSFDETYFYPDAYSYGDYFNFDASQGKIDLIFPEIRTQGGDSDVFYESLTPPSPSTCGEKCP